MTRTKHLFNIIGNESGHIEPITTDGAFPALFPVDQSVNFWPERIESTKLTIWRNCGITDGWIEQTEEFNDIMFSSVYGKYFVVSSIHTSIFNSLSVVDPGQYDHTIVHEYQLTEVEPPNIQQQ